jgi:hypothetical protein
MPDSSFTYLIKTLYEQTGVRLAQSDLEKLAATGSRVKAGMESASGGLSSLKSNADALVGSLGVAAGIGGLLALANSEANVVKETQRLSYVLGLTVEETSKWSYASERATGSSEGLGMAAFHAANALDEIRSGLGKGAEAARAMGIDPNGLRGIPDLLLKIGDFIKNSTLPQEEKLQLAHELLGRSARELFPLLARGSEGMQQLGNEAGKAGRVIDEQAVESVKRFSLLFSQFQNDLRRGVGLTAINFIIDHEGLVKAALEVAALAVAWKTFIALGGGELGKFLIFLSAELSGAAAGERQLAQATLERATAEKIATAAENEGTKAIMARRIAQVEAAEAQSMGVVNASQASIKAGMEAETVAASGLLGKLGAMAQAGIGLIAVFDVMFAIPKTIEFGKALGGLLMDLKHLHDAKGDEAALEKRAQPALERGRARGAKIRAAEQAAPPTAATTAPAAPRFQTEDAETRLSGEEEGLSEAKSDVAGRQNARSAKVDELKDAAEVAPNYELRKAALKSLREYEIQAEKEHRADLVDVGARASQLAIDQEKSATHDREQAKLQAEMAVRKPDEAEKRKSYDEAVKKEDDAHAKVLQIAEQYGAEATASDKRERDTRAKQIAESAADERKQQESHLEAIAGNEKASVAQRIAAIRALAEEKKKHAGRGERELIDAETAKKIGSLETKTEQHAPSYKVDSLAKIGGFVGNSIPTGGGDKQQAMADSLKAIEKALNDGLKIHEEPDGFRNH